MSVWPLPTNSSARVEEELALERSLESGLITIGASETALRLMLLSPPGALPHPAIRTPACASPTHSTPQPSRRSKNGLVDFAVVTSPVEIRKPPAQDPDFPIPGNSDRRIEICIPFRRAASSRRIVRISFYLACQRHRHAGAVRRVLSESQPRLPPRYGGGDNGSDSSYGRV